MDATSAIHLLAIPYPGRGHINAMMNLCKLLVSRHHHLVVTFVVTEEWLGFFGSDPTPHNIRLRSIPNVIPSELVRGADIVGFVEAVYTKMEAPFERLLERLEEKPSCIVADTYMPWAVSVGRRWNIPAASLWTMSASMFSILNHLSLNSNNYLPIYYATGQNGEEPVDNIPGISSIRIADFPAPVDATLFKRVLEPMSCGIKSQCLLLTSFYELENRAIDALRAELPLPIYSVGPSIPCMSLKDIPPKSMDSTQVDYFAWLDSQPKSSVLYVSLGSFLPISGPQMDEIATGLRASGARFLWVARGDATRLQVAGGGMGLVVPWCDQLRVLCHSSVGGFLTHCGWNSTMEAVYAGVPMLTFPIIWDQVPNAKLIVEDWGVGLRLKREMGNVVQGQEIAQAVKRLMNLEGDETKELIRRAKCMRKSCKRAIETGGSSDNNLRAFVEEIVESHKNQSS